MRPISLISSFRIYFQQQLLETIYIFRPKLNALIDSLLRSALYILTVSLLLTVTALINPCDVSIVETVMFTGEALSAVVGL